MDLRAVKRREQEMPIKFKARRAERKRAKSERKKKREPQHSSLQLQHWFWRLECWGSRFFFLSLLALFLSALLALNLIGISCSLLLTALKSIIPSFPFYLSFPSYPFSILKNLFDIRYQVLLYVLMVFNLFAGIASWYEEIK